MGVMNLKISTAAAQTVTVKHSLTFYLGQSLVCMIPLCLGKTYLIKNCKTKRYLDYTKLPQAPYNRLCDITIKQVDSDVWKHHRAGRITTSLRQRVATANDISTNSVLYDIMQYSKPVDNM